MATNPVEIDGAYLEGGGQILRIALALSALTKKPVRVTNIRANRSKPGLMEQHLNGVRLVASLCNGRLVGDSFGSKEIELWPEDLVGGTHEAKIRTAGSVTLLLQAALPVALFASTECELRLWGGTNTLMAPQVEYTTDVFLQNIASFGVKGYTFVLSRHGFFPKGGGYVSINVKPLVRLKAIDITDLGSRNDVRFYGNVICAFQARTSNINNATVVRRSEAQLRKVLLEHGYLKNWNEFASNREGIKMIREQTLAMNVRPASGHCVTLIAVPTNCHNIGGSAMGKPNQTPEEVIDEALKDILLTLDKGACLDKYCQDQLIIYMALAEGTSRIRVGGVTDHTKTAIFVCELLTDAKFVIIPQHDYRETSIIECEGIGYVN